VGVAGEIYVGGAGLARGYLDRPDLTAERFVPDPFSREPGARLYRSGDLARMLADGDLEYVGRADQQVKVRGFRIEPGEIEATLRRHEAVREAVVMMREDDAGDKRLVAYVVTEGATTGGELRAYLKSELPDYMIPSAIVSVEKMPLTASGKVDRKALPAPVQTRAGLQETYVPPHTPAQEIMSAVWSQVLDIHPVGIHDNFFALGGDSIRAIQVLGAAKARGLSFSLPDLFSHPTIAALSQVLSNNEAAPASHTEPFQLISPADREKLPPGVEDAYPLTMLQSGMLYHMTLTPEASVYHNVNSLRVRGPFDLEVMRRATQHVATQQAVLRTSFDLGAYSVPLQLVHESADLPVAFEDLRELPEAEQSKRIDDYVESEKTLFFDAAKPPLIRIKIHLLKDDEFQWTLTDFHPIIDGWAVAVMLAEISANYATLLAGGALGGVSSPPVTFRDYVGSELAILKDASAEEYLMRALDDGEPLQLPRLRARTEADDELEIRSTIIDIPEETLAGLQRLARSEAIPLHYVLLAAHVKVLGTLGGQEDVTTGLVMDGRLEEPGGEQVLGLYLNTMPFRTRLQRGTWMELVRKVFEVVLGLVPVRRFPLAALQNKRGGAPLFDSMFYFIDFHILHTLSQTGPLELVAGTHSFNNTHFPFQAMFSLDRAAESKDDSLKLRLDYDATRFDEAQLDAINAYYLKALRLIAADPQRRHDADSLLSEDERHTLLTVWNSTDVEREGDGAATIHELFDRQAARTPDAIALLSGDEQITYAELLARSNRLANYLRGRGVGAESRVGVCLGRSASMIETLLAVIKAGGAYVPLDPNYPQERIAFMLDDARPSVVVADARTRESLGGYDGGVVCLDDEAGEIAGRSEESPQVEVTGDSLAYVIYTSGSTGRPKGVLNTHRGAVNRFRWMWETYPFASGEVCCQKTSLNFVDSVWEIFGPLLQGVPLVVIPDDVVKDPPRLIESLSAHDVTRITVVPSFLRVLLDTSEDLQTRLPKLKYWTTSGEALTADLAKRFRALLPASTLLNLYGSSEVAADVTWCEARPEDGFDGVPIGRPITNSRIYLLNYDLQPVPLGTTGELYVGGEGLARGYQNRPDLTAERFVPDLFSREPGARLYRTGDLARHRADGQIEYQGRRDDQVKVRGFRVELGEVEAALREHESVRDATVAVREDTPGDQRLVAYVLTREADEEASARLRVYLKTKLPDYMIPSAVVPLEEFPLTASGKVDRKALPAPDRSRPAVEEPFVPTQNEVEETVARIWREVLGIERIGINDAFFDLGGNSLQAMQIVARVRDTFEAEIPLRRLFEAPTVAGLVNNIETYRREPHDEQLPPPIKRASRVARSGDRR
ncbi:MAG TPA: amino acid adenylation domain-containing protein, partial [Pyrinomonadaceae bacterium]|nr:amino acid adenylation domain-containing protein [Pyrinomonadaceae bacterium]